MKCFALFFIMLISFIFIMIMSLSFILKICTGDKIKYYRLPKNPKTQNEYQNILMTTDINWDKGHIFAKHWAKGNWGNTEDLPDIIAPNSQILKMEVKPENIQKKGWKIKVLNWKKKKN